METSKEEKEIGEYVPFGKVRGTRISSQEKQAPVGRVCACVCAGVCVHVDTHVHVCRSGERAACKYLRR